MIYSLIMKTAACIFLALIWLSGCALLELPGKALETVGIVAKTTGQVVETGGKCVTAAGRVIETAIKTPGVKDVVAGSIPH